MALVKGIVFEEDNDKKKCPICNDFYDEDKLVSTEDGDYRQEMNREIAEIIDDEYKKSKNYLLCEDCFEEMHKKYAARDDMDTPYPNADPDELEEELGDLLG